MKKVLCLISALVVMMLSCVTASAANEAKFKLRIVSESDTKAVLSFDYEGGTAVAALDVEISVNVNKLKVDKIEKGQGLNNFTLQAQTGFSMVDSDDSTARGSLAFLPGYRNVNGSDLFVITVKKLTKESITGNDVIVNIDNCASDSAAQIVPQVTYDFGEADADSPSNEEDPTVNQENPSSSAPSSTEGSAVEITVDEQGRTQFVTTTAEEKKPAETDEKGENTTIIITACAAVAVAGGAVAAAVIIKKKKSADKKEG